MSNDQTPAARCREIAKNLSDPYKAHAQDLVGLATILAEHLDAQQAPPSGETTAEPRPEWRCCDACGQMARIMRTVIDGKEYWHCPSCREQQQPTLTAADPSSVAAEVHVTDGGETSDLELAATAEMSIRALLGTNHGTAVNIRKGIAAVYSPVMSGLRARLTQAERERDTQATEWQASAEHCGRTIHELETQLAARSQEVLTLTGQRQERDTRITELEERLADRDGQLTDTQILVNQLQAQLAAPPGYLPYAELRQRLAEASQWNTELNRNAAYITEKRQAAENRVTELEADCARWRELDAQQRRGAEKLQARIAALEGQLAAVKPDEQFYAQPPAASRDAERLLQDVQRDIAASGWPATAQSSSFRQAFAKHVAPAIAGLVENRDHLIRRLDTAGHEVVELLTEQDEMGQCIDFLDDLRKSLLEDKRKVIESRDAAIKRAESAGARQATWPTCQSIARDIWRVWDATGQDCGPACDAIAQRIALGFGVTPPTSDEKGGAK